LVFSAENAASDDFVKKYSGRSVYAGPGYADFGGHQIVINRLLIRNIDPDTPIRVKYLLFRNQDRDVVPELGGRFFSKKGEDILTNEIVVAPLDFINFGVPGDAGTLYEYRADPNQGRPLFIVAWEADREVLRPPIGRG
jgi:hypothetical protein